MSFTEKEKLIIKHYFGDRVMSYFLIDTRK